MKFVQIGILACLVTISGLLAAIYRHQRLETVEATSVIHEAAAEPVGAAEALPALSVARRAPDVRAEEGDLAPVEAPRPEPVRTAPPRRAVVDPSPPQEPEPAIVEDAPAPVVTAESRAPAVSIDRVRDREPVAPPPPRTVVLPADMQLTARLGHTLSTERSRAGDEFRATLDEPVIVDGLIIADRGAFVEGRVADARRAGRIEGRSYLAVELTRLQTDDGQWIDLTTSTHAEEGRGTAKKDLKRIGITTGIGAAIGAIAGGGKGAAIGAGVGAGAGAGAAAAKRGEAVVLRPETLLYFQLTRPVAVTERI